MTNFPTILLIGPPCSGKTTIIQRFLRRANTQIVLLDQVLRELYPDNDDYTDDMLARGITSALEQLETYSNFKETIAELGYHDIEFIFKTIPPGLRIKTTLIIVRCSLPVLMERNLERSELERIPVEYIRRCIDSMSVLDTLLIPYPFHRLVEIDTSTQDEIEKFSSQGFQMNETSCSTTYSYIPRLESGKPAIESLLEYLRQIIESNNRVISSHQADFSQDRVKVVLHKERFRHFLLGEDDQILPITMEAWTSLACNARCLNCTYSQNDAKRDFERSGERLFSDISVIQKILHDFANAGVRSIIWTGGGEPTLNPELVQTVYATKAAGLKWGLFTNGMALSEGLIKNLLKADPSFLRISVNAGTQEGHNHEYRTSSSCFSLVKRNAIIAASATEASNRCVGLGYALDSDVSIKELDGIMTFITDVMNESDEKLGFVAFRPKVIFYRNGSLVTKQPKAKRFYDVPKLIENRIILPLQARFGANLRIDLKKAMFHRLAAATPPSLSLATPWSGAINHLGEGFIISELNGTPWPNAKYGSFAEEDFERVWFGRKRRNLLNRFKIGDLQAPAHHKMSHVDEMLIEIRSKVGILREHEVDEFYQRFDELEPPNIRNWDFL